MDNPDIINTIFDWASLISGILGMIFGGYAIHVVKGNSVVQKGNKIIKNDSQDNSLTAGNDIVQYNGIDSDTLAKINSANFSEAINAAYVLIDKKNDENIDSIFKKTKDYIDSMKLDISGYTKLDWIEQYLSNAKTISDDYMQEIWAKVLAKELSNPNTFSFKTLSVIRNMSKKDFDMLCDFASYAFDEAILTTLRDKGPSWDKYLLAQELELLTVHKSQREFDLEPDKKYIVFRNDHYCIVMSSLSGEKETLFFPCYLLTSFALEILKLFDITMNYEVMKLYVDDLRERAEDRVAININYVKSFDTSLNEDVGDIIY